MNFLFYHRLHFQVTNIVNYSKINFASFYMQWISLRQKSNKSVTKTLIISYVSVTCSWSLGRNLELKTGLLTRCIVVYAFVVAYLNKETSHNENLSFHYRYDALKRLKHSNIINILKFQMKSRNYEKVEKVIIWAILRINNNE